MMPGAAWLSPPREAVLVLRWEGRLVTRLPFWSQAQVDCAAPG